MYEYPQPDSNRRDQASYSDQIFPPPHHPELITEQREDIPRVAGSLSTGTV